MAKVDLKIAMKDSSMKDLDRTLSYVNGSLSNAALVEVAQQLVGLTTNTYVGGERVDRTDISQPTPGKPEPILTINAGGGGGSYTYNGDGVVYAYSSLQQDGSDPYFVKLDRVNKTFAVSSNGGSAPTYEIWIYATEGENYASKVEHAFYMD